MSLNENCAVLVKKVIRTVWSFGSTKEEMVHLWKTFCLSILDQSCVVWGSSLTEENRSDLERTQKTFCKLGLEEEYHSYNEALDIVGLQNLTERRKNMTLVFYQKKPC